MENLEKALSHLNGGGRELLLRPPVPFETFLKRIADKPNHIIRNIFQVFHDMILRYVEAGIDEYEGDPESIHYRHYDCSALFVEGADSPFFADRLFANRMISNIEALRSGAQQNKIYIFQGPHGCGKSTFLNNMLRRFEEYTRTEEGACFEVIWRLDRRLLRGAAGLNSALSEDGGIPLFAGSPAGEDATRGPGPGKSPDSPGTPDDGGSRAGGGLNGDILEVPCPSHDHPILLIPKPTRRAFLSDLFRNDPFAEQLFADKGYEWVFRNDPCTVCSSLYNALFAKLKDPRAVLRMLHVRHVAFNRRLGQGVTVFSPGDKPLKNNVLVHDVLQKRLDELLGESHRVKYIHSRYARTNNGVYALMDIKGHNVQRLTDLHNIISEGVHKVEDTEESVDSLFLALMNPEDKKNVEEFPSFSDRVAYIHLSYVMDLNTEVDIYRDIFGKQIEDRFLPRVLHNFARVIISTRLNLTSEAMNEWIEEPKKYSLYCDENLQLLKMEIYTGHIPPRLLEEDVKRFTAKRRRRIIREAEKEGVKGFSGRDSIRIFNDFLSQCAREDKLITMSALYDFFTRKVDKETKEAVPKAFLDSLTRMYDYSILQQVKESLYGYNEEEISRDIQNYLWAVNFDPGSISVCTYTGDRLEITEPFLEGIEKRLLGPGPDQDKRHAFRKDVQKEYASRTLTQEIRLDGKPVEETNLYAALHERYVHNLKEKVLDPFLENENFRRAIKAFHDEEFRTYDRKIQNDVRFLIRNLCNNHRYTEQGAQEVCVYVIDNDLARKFAQS